jgi:hypothetical protein
VAVLAAPVAVLGPARALAQEAPLAVAAVALAAWEAVASAGTWRRCCRRITHHVRTCRNAAPSAGYLCDAYKAVSENERCNIPRLSMPEIIRQRSCLLKSLTPSKHPANECSWVLLVINRQDGFEKACGFDICGWGHAGKPYWLLWRRLRWLRWQFWVGLGH